MMKAVYSSLILFFLLFIVGDSVCSDNGLGKLPPMGWNTWCSIGKCGRDVCYEDEIKDVANAMIANGMKDLGYNYINLDDCWASDSRDNNGNIQPDPARFPSGIKSLTAWLHNKGFKFGLYTSAGVYTCNHGERPKPIPGSYGHYEADAKTFASWNVDYVKLDWCDTKFPNGTEMNQKTMTGLFYKAMNATDRAMWLNFHCGSPPQEWCAEYGNSYRIGPDHHDEWDNTIRCMKALQGLGKSAGPGHWNDADFLETGGQGCSSSNSTAHCPGQSDDEYRSIFSLWSIANSALIVATDVRNMTAIMKEVLLNKELIDVNQDSLAIAGDLIGTWGCDAPAGSCQVWGKQVSDGFAAALYNANPQEHGITLDFSLFGMKGATLNVRDMWQHKDLGSFTGSYSAKVPPHGTVAVKLTKTGTS